MEPKWFDLTSNNVARTIFDALNPLDALCIVATAVFIFGFFRRSSGHLPPGPPGVPLLGNLHQITSTLWLDCARWKQQYGPIIYLSLLGQPVLVLSSHQVTTDLLNKRARVYSDRPRSIVAAEILTQGLLFILISNGELWRKMRRATADALSKRKVRDLRPAQVMESVLLMQTLLSHPDKWADHISHSVSLLTVNMVYGPSMTRSEALSVLPRIQQFATRLEEAVYPGAHLVEVIPWMRYLPSWMMKWKRDGEYWFKKDSELFERLYVNVEKLKAEGDEHASMTASLVSQHKVHGLDRKEVCWVAATVYAAGVETSAYVLTWFVLAMIHYPNVQRQAQAELDKVVGRSRMPTFDDHAELPFIRAIVKEILRWQPVAPLGVPHCLTEDDYYAGFFIPKGTLCFQNTWAMNRDPEVYGEDAHLFNPGRFLNSDGSFRKAPANTNDEGHLSFGFGKRRCVGMHLANDTLFINIACILWTFTLSGECDNGRPIAPLHASTETRSLLARPIPFSCDFTPRFPGVHAIVAASSEHENIR